jgi:methyl-accepting chemotaxis protein
MKIGTKILTGFVVLILMSWVITIISVNGNYKTDEILDDLGETGFIIFKEVHKIEESILDMNQLTTEYMFSDDNKPKAELVEKINTLLTASQTNLQNRTNLGDSEIVIPDKIIESSNTFFAKVKELLEINEQEPTRNNLLDFYEKNLAPAFRDVESSINSYINAQITGWDKTMEDLDERHDGNRVSTIIISVVVTIMGVFLAFFIGKLVSRPIIELTSAANDISRGELDTSVKKQSNDEIGELSEAFERMRVSLKSIISELKIEK